MLLQFAVGGSVVPFVTLLLRDRGLGMGQIGVIFAGAAAMLLVRPGHSDLTFTVWTGAVLCVAMAALAFFLPHTPPGAAGTDPRRLAYGPAVKLLVHDANFLVLLAGMFLVSGSYSVLSYY